jgi:lysophospholipase L1-like esterase
MAVVAVAAVIVAVAFATRGRARTVPVVGDSITFLATHDIAVALGGTYHPEIQSKIGQRIDQMLPPLRDALRTDPFAVVVNLGTNDALQARTHPDWRSGFARMVEMLAPARCVELATVSTLVDARGTPPVAVEINRAIAAAVSTHPNFHVVDWNAAVHRANGLSLLKSDRIHPSPAGQLALAVLIRSALDHDCRNA